MLFGGPSMFSIKNSIIYLFLLIGFLPSIKSTITIERYDRLNHREAVIKILDEHYHYLAYEALGSPKGTTEKYLDSSKYITDVIKVDDEVVGFVNYVAYDFNVLTFHIFRTGLIHLIGVAKDHQGNGYGKELLNHAIQELAKLKVPKIQLTVKRTNIGAIKFYEKTGFVCVFPEPTLPANIKDRFEDYSYSFKLNIPADQLPQGNILQRNPKKTALIVSAAIASLIWYLKFNEN